MYEVKSEELYSLHDEILTTMPTLDQAINITIDKMLALGEIGEEDYYVDSVVEELKKHGEYTTHEHNYVITKVEG